MVPAPSNSAIGKLSGTGVPLSLSHFICFTKERVPKSEGYLNRSFPGVEKGRKRGEKRGGKWWESEQGLKGKEGGKMRGKGWEQRGPKRHSKNSDFSTPLI